MNCIPEVMDFKVFQERSASQTSPGSCWYLWLSYHPALHFVYIIMLHPESTFWHLGLLDYLFNYYHYKGTVGLLMSPRALLLLQNHSRNSGFDFYFLHI